jgi:hypothetical protein
MTGSRPTRALRRAIGTAVAGLFAVAVVLALVTPWPGFAREPVSVRALPEPTASLVSCSGPLLAVGRDATDASQVTDAAPQEVAAATGVDELDGSVSRLEAPDVSGGAGPEALTALPIDRVRTDLAAAGSSRVDDDDLRGFAASSCAPPLMESWLVAGSGTTGAADVVLLSNPGGVAAEVALTVFGAEGAAQPAAGTGIVVPARTQRLVPLASLALGEESPVIRVNASGAPIQASLQASITRTLLTGGVDQVGVSAAPSELQVIPSVSVVAAPGEAGASESASVLRVLAPSDDTTATVTLTPVDGGTLLTEELPLTEGVPAELELGALAAGAYRVEIRAEAPVVAGLWTTTGFGAGSDFAWHSVPAVLTVPSLVAIAEGPSPMLTISNDEDADAVVALSGPDGDTQVTIPARGAVRIAVIDAAVYRLAPEGGTIRANVTYRGEGALAGYDVIPADAAAEPVVVYTQ